MRYLLLASNYFLNFFHFTFVLFIIFGWMFKESRFVNLMLFIFTFFSWFVLGRFFGYGYCFITDWHWKVKKKLGKHPLKGGYIKYILDSLTGKDFDSQKTESRVMKLTYIIFFISIILNLKDYFNSY